MEAEQRLDFKLNKKIVKPADYKNIFSNTECKSSDQYFLVLAKKNTLNQSRLGLAIAKKSIKKAVQRNRIKRLIREFFRKYDKINHYSIDFVVLARKNINLYENAVLSISLESNFKKVIKRLSVVQQKNKQC